MRWASALTGRSASLVGQRGQEGRRVKTICRIDEPAPRACTALESFDPKNRPLGTQLHCTDCQDAPDTLSPDDVQLQFDRRCASGFGVRLSDDLPRGAKIGLRYTAE